MECECGCGRLAAPGRRRSWRCLKEIERRRKGRQKTPERGKRHPTPRTRACEAIEGLWDVMADEEPDRIRLHRAWLRFLYAWRDYRAGGLKTVHKAPDTLP